MAFGGRPWIVAVAVTGLACGDPTAAQTPAIVLNPTEVREIVTELQRLLGEFSVGFPLAEALARQASFPTPLFDRAGNIPGTVVNCAGGGTVLTAGLTQPDSNPHASLTLSMVQCQTATLHVAMTGTLKYTASFDTTTNVGTTVTEGSPGVATLDGRSGPCPMNVTVTLGQGPNSRGVADSIRITATGLICGMPSATFIH